MTLLSSVVQANQGLERGRISNIFRKQLQRPMISIRWGTAVSFYGGDTRDARSNGVAYSEIDIRQILPTIFLEIGPIMPGLDENSREIARRKSP